jgi:hypothetical protein
MTAIPRLTLAALLAAALLAGPARAADDAPVAKNKSATPPALKYMPDNLSALLFVRTQALLASDAWKDLSKEVPELARAFELGKELPLEVAVTELLGYNAEDGAWVLAIETAKAVKAEAILKLKLDAALKPKAVGKHKVYQGNSLSFCVVDERTVLFGGERTVAKVLKRNGPPEIWEGVQALLKRADFSQTVTLAVDFTPFAENPEHAAEILGLRPSEVKAYLKVNKANVPEQALLQVRADKGLSVKLSAAYEDKAAAGRAWKGLTRDRSRLVADVRDKAPPTVVQLLKQAEFSHQDSQVHVRATVDAGSLVKLAKGLFEGGKGLALASGSTVSGKVMYDGKPLTHGSVTFLTEDNHTYLGRVNQDGTYQIKGVPPGPVRIGVLASAPQGMPKPKEAQKDGKKTKTYVDELKEKSPKPPKGFGDRMLPGTSPLPDAVAKQYKEPSKSPLRYRVLTGEQVHDIVLQGKDAGDRPKEK